MQREGKEKLAADILAEASRHFEDPAAAKPKKDGDKKSDKKKKADEAPNPVRGVLFSSFIVQ